MARGGNAVVRRAEDTQRQFRGRFTLRSAEEVVGGVPAGHGAFALTAGQFHFGAWMLAWLERYRREQPDSKITRLLITTWAIGSPGVQALCDVADEIGGDRPIWLLIDPHEARAANRKHLDAVAERIGPNAIRLVSIHAKVAAFSGSDLVLASSANLSGAPRSEWMVALRDPGFCETLGRFWDDVFEGLPAWRGEDTEHLPLKEQVRIIKEAAERHDMPAGSVVPASEPGPGEVWQGAENDQSAEADLLVKGGMRGRIAAMRRALAIKMERPRLRTAGEIAAAAKAEREMQEAEAQLGGADVEFGRALLEVLEPALKPRSYGERIRLAREGVRRVCESIRAGGAGTG